MSRLSLNLKVGMTVCVLLFQTAGCANRSQSSSLSVTQEPQSVPRQRESASTSELSLTTNAEDNVWSRLQQANTHYFVLIRHALAPGTGDPESFQLGDCSTQRNLSAQGRTQAKRIGAAFKKRQISVHQVLSSQWCRCLETAQLMDVGTVETFPPLNSFFSDRSTGAEQTQQIREFILARPNSPGVTIMVTHFVNISALSERGVSSGEMVVVQVNDENEASSN